jgi:hypothetical protein
MIRNLEIIVKAYICLDMPHVELESKARLKDGLLLELLADGQKDLSNQELDSIASVYGNQFKDVGYHFLSSTLFNEVIVTKDRISL